MVSMFSIVVGSIVQGPQTSSADLRIVLLGKTGVGKSAAGNTILREDVFKCDLSASSVTETCKKITKNVNGRRVAVIDTPGLFDPSFTSEATVNRIKDCISLAAPGPHAFLLVVQIGSRFTQEDCQVVEVFLKIFGEDAGRHALVLFTHGDKLGDKCIYEFLCQNEDLVRVYNKFKRRYHVFNNDVQDSAQVDQLLEKIDQMVSENGGGYYTNKMLQMAEQAIEEEKQRILKENEEQNQRQREALRQESNYEAEMQLMRFQEDAAREQAERNNRYITMITTFLFEIMEMFIRKKLGK